MKIILDTHCHTIVSGHAYSTVGEYAKEASRKGLELIAITNHGPKTPGMLGDEIYFLNMKAIPKKLYDVEILSGIELNILNIDGDVDLREDWIKPLDVVIASLHDVCIAPSSKKNNTKAIINAIKNPLIKIIGHLGDPVYPFDAKEVVKAAVDYNTAIEINEASGEGYRAGGDEVVIELIKLCKHNKVPITWGTDAHFHTYVGEFDYTRRISDAAGLTEDDVLNTSVEKFMQFIKQ
jgi:putative hydrolase